MADKATASVKVHMSDSLELDLRRLADGDDRTLSDYIRSVLVRHAHGHLALLAEKSEGANRGEVGRE